MPVAWPAVRLIDCSVPTAHVDVTCSVLAEQLLPSGSLPDTSTVDCSSVMHVMNLSLSGNALMGLPWRERESVCVSVSVYVCMCVWHAGPHMAPFRRLG